MNTEQIKQQARDLNTSFVESIKQGRAYSDPDLTPEGLENKRIDQLAHGQKRHIDQAEALRAQVSTSLYYAEGRVERPGVKWGDPASVAQAEAKWRQARDLMDAGMSLEEVIDSADEAMLPSLYENGPALLRAEAAKAGHDQHSVNLEPLHARLDKRAATFSKYAGLATYRERLAAKAYVDVIADHIRDHVPALEDTGIGISVLADSREQKAEHVAAQVLG